MSRKIDRDESERSILSATDSYLVALNTVQSQYYALHVATKHEQYGHVFLEDCCVITELTSNWYVGNSRHLYQCLTPSDAGRKIFECPSPPTCPLSEGLFSLCYYNNYLIAAAHHHETDVLHIISLPSYQFWSLPLNGSLIDMCFGDFGIVLSCFDQGGCMISHQPWPTQQDSLWLSPVSKVVSQHASPQEYYFAIGDNSEAHEFWAFRFPLYQQSTALPTQIMGEVSRFSLSHPAITYMGTVMLPLSDMSLTHQDHLIHVIVPDPETSIFCTSQGIYQWKDYQTIFPLLTPNPFFPFQQAVYHKKSRTIGVIDAKNALQTLLIR